MSFDAASGAIAWTPGAGQTGDQAVVVRASDGRAFAEQSYVVAVSADPVPLSVTLAVTPTVVDAGESVTVTVAADGGVGPASLSLTLEGTPVPLDAGNQAVVSRSTPGRYELVATADDGRTTAQDRATFSVRDPGDTTPPVASITAPGDGSEITAPTEIIGTADDANLVDYRLRIAPARSGDYTEIASGSSPVVDGVLGTLDPTSLRNGLYDVELTATDANGQQSRSTATYRVSGDLKVGNFSVTFEDLTVALPGLAVTVTRTYDSRDRARSGAFGHGWRIGYRSLRLERGSGVKRGAGSGLAIQHRGERGQVLQSNTARGERGQVLQSNPAWVVLPHGPSPTHRARRRSVPRDRPRRWPRGDLFRR